MKTSLTLPMIVCNYLLTWENESGNIIQRWTSISSASQYNNGETSSSREAQITYRSDQLMILTPFDDESLLIPHGKRFIIDSRCKIYENNFETGTTIDTSKTVLTYGVTRIDNVLFDYEDSGHAEFMAYQDEQHEDDGYYVINGNGYWLCGKPSASGGSSTTHAVKSCVIVCDDSNAVYCGLGQSIFYAQLFNENGERTTAVYHWEINCEFANKLSVSYVDNSICISADDSKLVGKSFELLLHSDGFESASVTVSIKALI